MSFASLLLDQCMWNCLRAQLAANAHATMQLLKFTYWKSEVISVTEANLKLFCYHLGLTLSLLAWQLIFPSRQQILVHNSGLFKSYSLFFQQKVLWDTVSHFRELQLSLATVPHVLIVLAKCEKKANYVPFNMPCYKYLLYSVDFWATFVIIYTIWTHLPT